LPNLSWAALRDRLRTSLWLVPVGFSILAAGLALGLVEVDEELAPDTSGWFLYGGQADGARELLSTIASSMLTIAGAGLLDHDPGAAARQLAVLTAHPQHVPAGPGDPELARDVPG